MSDHISSKNDLDTDETTSWEILSDQQSSRSSSIENIAIDEFDKTELQEKADKTDLEHVLIDIPDDKNDKESPVEDKTEETKTDWKKLKSKAKKKIKAPENLTILSIAASLFTITGLTLLCCLFPSETDRTSLENIKNDYFEVIRGDTSYVQNAFNKTTEILTAIHNSTNYHNATNQSSENVCLNEEEDYSFNFPDEFTHEEPSTSFDSYSLKNLQNATSNLIFNIRDACLDPNVQILLCSLMQDVLLIKLIQHIGKNQVFPTNLKRTNRLNKKRKTDGKKTKKTDKIMTKSTIGIGKNSGNNSSDDTTKENGKSECERRFEELENKWQYVGKNHRQKLQEIKEEFKSEIFQMKGKEKEHSLRKQKIKSIRDKYVQKIKADRERYLRQLKKIKDERHRVMHEICKNKKIETQSKDAAVGNYGMLIPEYDLKTRLNNLNKTKEPETNGAIPVLTNKQFEQCSKFWNNFPAPKLNKQEEISSEDDSDDENTDYMRDFVTKLICMTVSFDNGQDIWLPPKKLNNKKPYRKNEAGDLIWSPIDSNDSLSTIIANSKIKEKNVSDTSKKSLQTPSTARFALRKTFEETDFSGMNWKKNQITKNDTSKKGSNEKFPFLSVPPKNSISIAECNETDNIPKNKPITLRSLLKKSKTSPNTSKSGSIVDKNDSKQVINIRNESKIDNIKEDTVKKPDLYQLLFDIDGEKVRKKEEELLEGSHKKFTPPSPVQMMSKQNPKLPKKVYLFKGRL